MTQSQLLDLLMLRLGHRSNSDIRAAAALEAALGQVELEQGPFHPWFLEQDYTTSFVTATGVESVALPATYVGLSDEVPYIYYSDPLNLGIDPWVPVPFVGFGPLRKTVQDTGDDSDQSGAPLIASLFGTNIYFRPIPDAVYSLRLFAYFSVTPFSDTGTASVWTTYAPDWILARALARVASSHLADMELAQVALMEEKVAHDRVYRGHIARMNQGRTGRMGE